ncbi:MAG TPA: hypothetical protein VNI01_00530 [Elusimicrobiota bacterium]|nr:hypothetical protein [Elusimicrobiota bacterium]
MKSPRPGARTHTLRRAAWAAGAVLAAGALFLGARVPRRARRGLWEGLSPIQLEERVEGFLSGLTRARGELKLVVAVVDATQSSLGESRKSAFGVDLGTTRAAVSAPVRIHYAVDLSAPGAVEFRPDAAARRFEAVFPEPEVQAVEVFSRDARRTVEAGWARARAFSGTALQDRLDRGLYDQARAEAASPRAVAAIKPQARAALARLVGGYLRRGGAWGGERGFREVSIRFRGEGADEPRAWLEPPLESP